MNGKNTLMVSG